MNCIDRPLGTLASGWGTLQETEEGGVKLECLLSWLLPGLMALGWLVPLLKGSASVRHPCSQGSPLTGFVTAPSPPLQAQGPSTAAWPGGLRKPLSVSRKSAQTPVSGPFINLSSNYPVYV